MRFPHLSRGFVVLLSSSNIFSLSDEDNSRVSSIICKMRYCFYTNFYRNFALCVRFIVDSITSHSPINNYDILSARLRFI